MAKDTKETIVDINPEEVVDATTTEGEEVKETKSVEKSEDKKSDDKKAEKEKKVESKKSGPKKAEEVKAEKDSEVKPDASKDLDTVEVKVDTSKDEKSDKAKKDKPEPKEVAKDTDKEEKAETAEPAKETKSEPKKAETQNKAKKIPETIMLTPNIPLFRGPSESSRIRGGAGVAIVLEKVGKFAKISYVRRGLGSQIGYVIIDE